MPDDRRIKHEGQQEREAMKMPGPIKELGPERRVEIARRAEAKRPRGRPPAI